MASNGTRVRHGVVLSAAAMWGMIKLNFWLSFANLHYRSSARAFSLTVEEAIWVQNKFWVSYLLQCNLRIIPSNKNGTGAYCLALNGKLFGKGQSWKTSKSYQINLLFRVESITVYFVDCKTFECLFSHFIMSSETRSFNYGLPS